MENELIVKPRFPYLNKGSVGSWKPLGFQNGWGGSADPRK